MYRQLMNDLLARKDLSFEDLYTFLREHVQQRTVTDLQLAALLVALKFKGESAEELLAFRNFILENALLKAQFPGTIDVCGTGGDGQGSFNVSSMSALILSAAGLKVAKHGNRAVSGKCGSADFYEQLGLKFFSDQGKIEVMLNETGFVFLFAPLFHPIFREFQPVRQQLGMITVFNYLGPFVNPLQPERQLIGCFSREALRICAALAEKLEERSFFLVHSQDGYDEISLNASSTIISVGNGRKATFNLDPQKYFQLNGNYSLRAESSRQNVQIFNSILQNEDSPFLKTVLLNCAAALLLAKKVTDFSSGLELAGETIVSGKARATFKKILQLQEKL